MQQVRPAELPALVAELQAQGLAPVLLDVREPWEVTLASIAPAGVTSICIPMQQIPSRLSELDPAQPILTLCHHGMRSAQVAMFLTKQGYAGMYNVEGGIDAWSCTVDAAVPRY